MRLFFSISICLSILAFSCSTTQKTNSNAFSELNIGYGGGATGMMNGYTIDSTGKVFSWSGRFMKDNLTDLITLHNDSLKAISDILNKEGLSKMKYEEPGNLYRMIKIKTANEENHIVWGFNPDSTTEIKLNEIYKKIQSIIKNSQ